MPVTFERAKKEVTNLLLEVRNKHHPGLCEPEVTVDILMTEEVDEEGQVLPTLKHNKYPAIAVIKATSLKERALGLADALLVIDAVRWDELGESKEWRHLITNCNTWKSSWTTRVESRSWTIYSVRS